MFNYGFIPRTWEDGAKGGDNDPVDLVDLGQNNRKDILTVCDFVVLGSLGLVDQGEIDWKILTMEVNEAKEKGVETM
jgi:inorganic pyrophosphatase